MLAALSLLQKAYARQKTERIAAAKTSQLHVQTVDVKM